MTYALFFEIRDGDNGEQFVFTPPLAIPSGQVPPILAHRTVHRSSSSSWRMYPAAGTYFRTSPMDDPDTIVDQFIHVFDQCAPFLKNQLAKPGHTASRPIPIELNNDEIDALKANPQRIPQILLDSASSLVSSSSVSTQAMPTETIEFLQGAFKHIQETWKDDSTGRIFYSLATSTDKFRIWIAYALFAAGAQAVNGHYGTYLRAISVSPLTNPKAQTSSAANPSKGSFVKKEYSRPNGSVYFSRDWGGFEDVMVLRKSREVGSFVLLVGPPGTGKTAMAEGAFGEELITVVITRDTEVSDLVGSFVPDPEGGFVWEDGPLLIAVREGRPILLDEVLLADPKVLAVIYPLMDGRGILFVSSNPEIGEVKAAPGFWIMGAGNPHVPGAKMSDALVSRFSLHVEVTTDYELAKEIGVPETVCDFAEALYSHFTAGSISWAPQFRELLTFKSVDEVWGREFAVRNLLRLCPEGDRSVVAGMAAQTFQGAKATPAKI